MIEDKELCDLFKAESEEHLQSLDEGLLRLESNPKDTRTLEQVFRNAHSLKGTARMLGVSGVETIGHHFEDVLGAAARGQVMLSPEVIDRLYRGLDAIRKLVHEAVTGEPAGVDVSRVLAQLSGESEAASTEPVAAAPPPPTPTTNGSISPVPDSAANETPVDAVVPPEVVPPEVVPSQVVPPVAGAPNGLVASAVNGRPAEVPTGAVADSPLHPPDAPVHTPPPAAPAEASEQAAFKIQTIRVEPSRLDILMTMAGELTVTTARVARGMADFEAMVSLWEEWSKDTLRNRSLLSELERSTQDGAAGNTGTLKQLAKFHEREQARLEQLGVLLGHLKQTTYEDVTRLDFVADELEEAIRKVRLLPLSTIFNLFPRMVRDLARAQDKEVQLLIEGGETAADKRILEELKDPIMHMMRNAIDHGIEAPAERERNGKPRQATLRLRACQTATNVIIEIADDGRGLDLDAIKRTAIKRHVVREDELATMTREQVQSLIFSPGFSTSPLVTDVSGRGVGLDVVRDNIEHLRGTIEIESLPGLGCTFRIQLPITLATTRVLLAQVAGRTYALPVEFVSGLALVSQRAIFTIEGRETYRLDGQPVSIARLANLLEVHETRTTLASKNKIATKAGTTAQEQLPCIFLQIGDHRLGLLVDALVDEQEIMLKPLGAMLKRVRNVSGSTILGTGEVCMILNPLDLIKSVRKAPARVASPTPSEAGPEVERKKTVLLAEDSITTRTQEKRILESAGYEVVTAVDGLDAYHKLGTRDFDAVVSDIEMPNMNGLALAEKIRQDAKYKELPIILVTSLASEEDRRRGIEVGANAYITKGAFEQKVLLDTLRRLA
ncbi:MAG: hybrid sensor histidine kinase/response regulator [Armatimonadota bacterium]|nr:hybrid sensor histidine kinase/response regulator [Armatimonadota bacterium]